ncbi:MAG: DNA-processing protein DprA [Halioglobus sp.]
MRVIELGPDQGTATVVAIGDALYPPLLREIHDPPAALYVRGDPAALSRPMLAMVGSRRASAAGLRLARELARLLSDAGLQVCSGLALGIDAAAHRGALQGCAGTLAVMATGIDSVYPRRHAALATDIIANGCLVTEFTPGMPPLRENFPRRNRIVSGLSLGVLVVEAALPSGSLITARTAMEQNREVFALPWSPLHDRGAGCLHLLRDGAKMVQAVDDILEEVGPLFTLARQGVPDTATTGPIDEGPLLGHLGYEAVALDELLQHSGLTTEEALRELSRLEVAGHVSRVPGGYIRC